MTNPSISKAGDSDKVSEVVSLLKEVSTSFEPAVIACSFGLEDMVLLDLIARHARAIGIFTLDTGRLPEETHQLMSVVRERYPVGIAVYVPERSELETYLRQNGPNAFYDSVSQRHECCNIRKVIPLQRALEGKRAWIAGLRREQSLTREGLNKKVWDEAHGLYKFSPLLEWSLEDVWSYIRQNDVPYNELHDRGYPSIGCAPCTRAIRPGEEIRSGRWWWEKGGSKECGLHVQPTR
jgi:phosphoadenosine phosphosulfate reductase